MPLQYLQFRPGVSRESTDLANSGGWYACDKIRFRSGMPEKIGGWSLATSETFLGTCKHIVEFLTLSGFYLLGLGTNLKYYIYSGGLYWDITPIRVTLNLPTNPFYPIYSTLAANISASATTITVTSGTTFTRAYPYVIKIGSEEIWVESAATATLSNCIRGYNGTTAAAHTAGNTVSSSYLIVNSPDNGAVVDDFVTFSGATAFGPYTIDDLNAEFQVKGTEGSYIAIDVGVQSTSATSGGGSAPVVAAYQITTGYDTTSFGNGWGAGPWNGNHGWNTPWVSGGIEYELRLWSADSFGQDLFFNAEYGPVYYWSGADVSTTGQITTRGVNIIDLPGTDGFAPAVATRVLVTDERHVVALGCNDPTLPDVTAGAFVSGTPYVITSVGSTNFTLIGASKNEVGQYFVASGVGTGSGTAKNVTRDPLLVQWCTQEDYLVWDPTDITNTAGFYRLTYGSEIVSHEKTRQEVLIWTDSAMYSMQYQGQPFIFGFNTVSNETTIASPNAVTTANNITYWMGIDKFYAYSGRVDTLPCSLRQYVFDDFNTAQSAQVVSGTNEKYNEIWWFYPSADSDTIDRYVIYNYLEKLWYYGQLERTAWLDSHIQGLPWATVDGMLVQHESSLDNGTTNPPSAISCYIESADFDLGEGDSFSFVKRVIPDVDFIGSTNTTPSVTMTISARNYPGQGTFQNTQTPAVAGSEVTTQVYNYTEQMWIRLRGRQVAFKISSDVVGIKWQLGVPRLELQPDGRR